MKSSFVVLILVGIAFLVVVTVSDRSRAAFGPRQPTGATAEVHRGAGDRKVEESLASAMDWLARHQELKDGYWDSDGFSDRCETGACENKGYPLHDPGVTGLATLVFLRCGHTPEEGKYKQSVVWALNYFKRVQDEDGCFCAQVGHYMYPHAIVTIAVAEAYMRTQSSLLRKPLEKALEFIYMAQNSDFRGKKLAWRYSPQSGDNDTSVTAWVAEALCVASHAGCEVPREALDGARRWIDRMTESETGRIGYMRRGEISKRAPGRSEKWPPKKSEAITAAGLACRIHLSGVPKKDEVFTRGLGLCLKKLPRWNEKDGSIDMYYWYHATRAFAHLGGPRWKKWQGALKTAVLKNQHRGGCSRGSWDPRGPWGEDGGRVYSTAMMALCLAAMK